MTYHPEVLIVTAGGGEHGWGHAVRQLALSRALVGRGIQVAVASNDEPLKRLEWPCPVRSAWGQATLPDTGVLVRDLPPEMLWTERAEIAFCDHPDQGEPDCDILVSCHIGAEERVQWEEGRSYLCGPMWAPLRDAFRSPTHNWSKRENHYGVARPDNMPDTFDAEDLARWLQRHKKAEPPASMVALEALALGVPIEVYAPTPAHEPIAEAINADGGETEVDGNATQRLAAMIYRML